MYRGSPGLGISWSNSSFKFGVPHQASSRLVQALTSLQTTHTHHSELVTSSNHSDGTKQSTVTACALEPSAERILGATMAEVFCDDKSQPCRRGPVSRHKSA